MLALMKGRYTARLGAGPADFARSATLRYQCFVAARGLGDDEGGQDHDAFDADCLQMLVEEAGSGTLACTYRLMVFGSGAGLMRSYAAQFYDLQGLSRHPAPVMELGRFCVAPDRRTDADLLRVAWGAITRLVECMGCRCCSAAHPLPGRTLRRIMMPCARCVVISGQCISARHAKGRPWRCRTGHMMHTAR
jgi:L-ornithine Nalpha-acyltransferase